MLGRLDTHKEISAVCLNNTSEMLYTGDASGSICVWGITDRQTMKSTSKTLKTSPHTSLVDAIVSLGDDVFGMLAVELLLL